MMKEVAVKFFLLDVLTADHEPFWNLQLQELLPLTQFWFDFVAADDKKFTAFLKFYFCPPVCGHSKGFTF